MKKYLFLVACLLSLNAHGECSVADRARAKSIRTISLQQNEPEVSFYFRSGYRAILLDPALVRKRIEEQFKKSDALSDGQLLKDISDSRGRGKYTDLFAFMIKNPMVLQSIERLVANMVDRGEAAIVEVRHLRGESGWLIPTVERLEYSSGVFSERRFCTPEGDLLLRITDSID